MQDGREQDGRKEKCLAKAMDSFLSIFVFREALNMGVKHVNFRVR